MAKKTVALVVVELSTKEVVNSVPVRNKSDRQIEIILHGMLRNMDTDRFFVCEVEE